MINDKVGSAFQYVATCAIILTSIGLGWQNYTLKKTLPHIQDELSTTSKPVTLSLEKSADGLSLYVPDELSISTSTTGDCSKCSTANSDLNTGEAPKINIAAGQLFSLLTNRFFSAASPFTLAILFSPEDCPQCLHAADRWNSLARYKPDKMRVIGIVDLATRPEMIQFASRLNISFPLINDRTSSVRSLFSVRYTPTVLLLSQHGDILLESNHDVTPSAQDSLVTNIKARLEEQLIAHKP